MNLSDNQGLSEKLKFVDFFVFRYTLTAAGKKRLRKEKSKNG